ncbi:hypothetical protein ElyMa_003822900 [Elysia marginata]|uniref:Uncharacterized protein n=1 Tax=Elysia marginata TaxID=1093978 RepID=A0AAV4FEF0_9GAST|nr:hypothetical protein ElyMa_003822900 [Elysia marginata]
MVQGNSDGIAGYFFWRPFITYLLRPLIPCVWGSSQRSRQFLGEALQLSTRMTQLISVRFEVSTPIVSRLFSFSLYLSAPGKGLSCRIGNWFSQHVPNPPLPPLRWLYFNRPQSHLLPQLFVANLFWPLDYPNVFKDSRHKGLYLVRCCKGKYPGFGPKQQN